ncbi:aminotransferase class I/II-fold pyridoxal phosphate-dependent enzyme [Duganella sp. FT80W]|uniref:Aminotransferase class I/II-fold pyridoxal phosphate-dependent enzyme n=1 Tax=Duganella guangzhouensis TaxID=2666084 RepID=A0A6I2L0S8_9BURK|nr:PLP-dependent aminotransferase family protein [Duganella guangzhouensis]MRW91798.1 aminotransferase class I/II-fold pyridoxal phosphate-dependent enzyme [Duganella guangzhouensis]
MSEVSISDYLLTHLQRGGPVPMNRQLYALLRDGILNRAIQPGLQVPPTRALAADLGVSRNTVTYAYDQLIAEGYLEARTGDGTYVADTEPNMARLSAAAPARPKATRSAAGTTVARMASGTVAGGVARGATTGSAADDAVGAAIDSGAGSALSSRGARLLSGTGASSAQWGAFMPGIPDITRFPHAVWSKLQARHWRRIAPALLTYGDGAGYPPLREAIAGHLRTARAVNCTADQVIVTSGTHQSIQLAATLLGEAGDTAWVEDPCYWGTRNVIRSSGLTPLPLPVDAEGMQLPEEALRTPPRFIFVTPSHQYPLGPVMSLARRRLLLEYAARHNVWVVEDDYDSEFRYSGPPLASLQGLDSNERVIYLGTFSKTLFPGLRIGFMVVPAALAPRFARANAELFRDGQSFLHAVLADFINEGHFSSHVRKMRQLYAERLACLQAAIRVELGDTATISGSDAGLHLALGLPAGTNDVAISQAARERGILTRPLSAYYADPANAKPGLMLGYAAVPTENIPMLFAELAKDIRAQVNVCA